MVEAEPEDRHDALFLWVVGAQARGGPRCLKAGASIRARPAARCRRRSATRSSPRREPTTPTRSCGLIVGDGLAAAGGLALRYVPTRNRAASPYRYEIDPNELLRLTIETDDADEVFWGIVHSHTHTPGALPRRPTSGWRSIRSALYLLVSLSETRPTRDGGTGHPRLADRRGHGPRSRAAVTRREPAQRGARGARARGVGARRGRDGRGSEPARLDALVHPPALIRAALVGVSAGLAVLLLSRGLGRLASGTDDVAGLVRGVRLVFLAVAAGAAGAGWALGNALPLVLALVIGGMDVVETSFLLVVVAAGGVNRRG